MIEGFSSSSYSTSLRGSKLRQSVFEDAKGFNEYASAALELSDPYLSPDGLFSTTRSVRDIDQNKRRKYLYHVAISTGLAEGHNKDTKTNVFKTTTMTVPPAELHEHIVAHLPSPSGRKVAIFREEVIKSAPKRQQVLEVWTNHGQTLSRRILLPEKQHGKLIFDAATFGGPSWNADETVLVYVAERAPPPTASFFGTPTYEEAFAEENKDEQQSENGQTAVRGGVHTLGYGKSEGWGEKYPRQTPLLDLFLTNVETGRVGKVENCPGSETGQTTTLGSFALGQPVFEPTLGHTVVYTAWDAGGGPEMPRRLGLIYCQQRPSKLYASPVRKLMERLATPHSAENSDASSWAASNDESGSNSSGGNGNGNNNSNSGGEQSSENKGGKAGLTSSQKQEKAQEEDKQQQLAEKDGACYCLTFDSRLARCPRFSPVANGKSKLVYLSSKDGFDTHSGCFGLNCVDWSKGRPASSHRTLLTPVWNPNDSPDEWGTVLGMKFPGLFLQQLPAQCFLSPEYLLVTTQWGSSLRMVRVSLKTGALTPIKHQSLQEKESDSVLCVHEDKGVVGMASAPNKVPYVWHAPTSSFLKDDKNNAIVIQEDEQTIFDSISSPIAASKFSTVPEKPYLDFKSDIQFLVDKDLPHVKSVQIKGVPVQTILLLPGNKAADNPLPPLVVVPHGGPHSASTTSFLPSAAFLCCYGGYAVALVNYRGSTGFGQGLVESLPGNIGDLDVKDVVAATLQIKKSGLVDPNRIGICGGSHGGFLTAHCTGQYPDLFRAAVMRNPVTNLGSMATATDIPDWVFVEGLGKYDWMTYRPPASKEEVSALWDKSPIRYVANVKAPTLVALGLQDLRVPPSQGLEWYHSLRSSRIPTKLLMYEDNDHAILGTAAEADHWINIKRWFDEHL